MVPETLKNARYVGFYWPHGNGYNRYEPYLYVKLDGQDVAIWHERGYLRYG